MNYNNLTPVYTENSYKVCSMLDTCNCPECIEWNAPLCQLCYLTRCEVKTFPEYKKYCHNCVPNDKTLVFIFGSQRIKIATTKETVRKYPKSIFTFMLEDDNKIIQD